MNAMAITFVSRFKNKTVTMKHCTCSILALNEHLYNYGSDNEVHNDDKLADYTYDTYIFSADI